MAKKLNLNKIMENYVSNTMELLKKDIDKSIRYANNELYEEVNKMYDSFIEQFYEYETTSYIRHWEGVAGTRTGQNLYLGKCIRKYNGWKPTLSILLPEDIGYSSTMNGGYQYDKPEDVLDYVVNGYRFPYQFKHLKEPKKKDVMIWTGIYNGKYFNYKGTMRDAFDEFDEKFDELATEIIMSYLKNKYYSIIHS